MFAGNAEKCLLIVIRVQNVVVRWSLLTSSQRAAQPHVQRILARFALNVSVNCILLRLAIMSAVMKSAGCTANASRWAASPKERRLL